MIRRRRVLQFLSTGASLPVLQRVWSQPQAPPYPTKPLRIVVPYPPGTTSDTIVRGVGQKLSERLGQPVTVENRSGANGSVGTSEVLRAAPDGHTLVLGLHGTMILNPLLFRSTPYSVDDFVAVCGLMKATFVLVATPSFPANSVQELIAEATRRPGGVDSGTYGVGSSAHLAIATLNTTAGTKLNSVHYSTSPITDVANGVLSLSVEPFPLATPYIKSGRVKALAVTSLLRNPAFPDVQAIAEVLQGFEVAPWYGLFAPKGTPQAIAERLAREVREILQSPEIGSVIAGSGGMPLPLSPNQLADLIRRDVAEAPQLMKTAKLTAN